MPFKRDLGPLKYTFLKQPFKTQTQIENEDITGSPQYNLRATWTNKRRALSLQEVQLDGWFLIIHIVLETCTSLYMSFCIAFLYSWIDVLDLNQPCNWKAKIWEPFKMELIWGLQSWPLISAHLFPFYWLLDTKKKLNKGELCTYSTTVHKPSMPVTLQWDFIASPPFDASAVTARHCPHLLPPTSAFHSLWPLRSSIITAPLWFWVGDPCANPSPAHGEAVLL